MPFLFLCQTNIIKQRKGEIKMNMTVKELKDILTNTGDRKERYYGCDEL